MPSTPKAPEYKAQLLNHLIEAALDAIKRARAAWLLGVIIVFVFGVAVFNATFSWNEGQIERRAKLYIAAVQGYDAVETLTRSEPAIGEALNGGAGELGYFSTLWDASKNKQAALNRLKVDAAVQEIKEQAESEKEEREQAEKEREEKEQPQARVSKEAVEAEKARKLKEEKARQKLKDEKAGLKLEAEKVRQKLEDEIKATLLELKSASFVDLNAHVARRNAFDTVGLPFIGASVTASDYGIVGGLALVIVGYWLTAMLRREHLVLGEFVRTNDDGHLVRGYQKYAPADLIYACHRIKHYMVFSVPEPSSRFRYVTTASFFAAPFLLVVNNYFTLKDIFNKRLFGSYQWAHFIAELLIVFLGVAVWISGWLYQYRSMRLMQRWEIESAKANPFPEG